MHFTAAQHAVNVAQQSDVRRILCSNEHSKLCFRPTGSVLSDENHLPDLTVGEFPPKSEILMRKRV